MFRFLTPLIAAAVALFATPAHPADYWSLPVPPQGEAPENAHALVTDLASQACGLCHQKQYEQWRDSLHARAFSPGLVGQLHAFDAADQTDCLICHAPRSEQHDDWFSHGYSAEEQVHGVDCAACHVRGHVRHGPRPVASTPHGAVRGEPQFGEARFCSACHQFDDTGATLNGKPLENTYAEWEASRYASAGVTCQDCHMPQGSHRFLGIHDPDMTRQALGVVAWRTAEGVRLQARNRGAGHALPTYATPRIVLSISAAGGGAAREAQHVIQRRLHWSPEGGLEELGDTRLEVDQAVALALELEPERPATALVRVEPDADYAERIYPGLLHWLAEGLDEPGTRRLTEAMEDAGASGYVLYRFRCDAWAGREQPCDAME